MGMKRFIPYFKLLKKVKLAFAGALIFGLIAGVSSGFGVPFMTKVILPKLFHNNDAEQVQVYVSEDGNDLWTGTKDRPFQTMTRALEEVDDLSSTRWSRIEIVDLDKVAEENLSEPGGDADGSTALLWVAFIPLVFALRGLGTFFNVYLVTYCGLKILESIRMMVFEKLQQLHLGFFNRHKSGDLISRIINDTDQLKQTISSISNDLILQPFTFLAAMSYLAYASYTNKDVGYLLLFMLIIPLCVIPARLFGKKLQLRAAEMQRQMGGVLECARENLNSTREIRAYNMEQTQQSGFQQVLRRFFLIQLKVVKYNKALKPSIEFITACGTSVAIFYAAANQISLSEVTAILAALYMAYEPVKKLGEIHNHLKRGTASLDRLEEILHAEVDITDAPHAIELGHVEGRIEFKDVSFSYEDTPTLTHVECLINPGEVCALVGSSGAGKTTFVNLLCRFYDVKSGQILLDGLDLRHIKQRSLRHNIALVSQDPVLFNDTILENIRIGRPNASDKEVEQAADNAHAKDFIQLTEKGYHTVIGEKGVRLSGGQRQRLAIARAFLKNAPILILDEATSALDSESEAKVQDALSQLIKNKTVLIVAHRFSTIQFADRILVFDKGQLISNGHHHEVYAACDVYRNLYDKQSSST